MLRATWRGTGNVAATPASTPGRKPPKVISPSDPSSAWTAKGNKRVQFGYGLNYLIDVEHAIIVDVEATPARTSREQKQLYHGIFRQHRPRADLVRRRSLAKE